MYDNGDVTVTLLGDQPTNILGITYEDTQENQLNHGRGNDPIGYSEGKISYSGSITLGLDEVSAIEAIAPNGDIKKIKPFTIIVSYLNDDMGIIHDVITCKFIGRKRTSNSGDMNLSAELQLLVLNVQFNVKNL